MISMPINNEHFINECIKNPVLFQRQNANKATNIKREYDGKKFIIESVAYFDYSID